MIAMLVLTEDENEETNEFVDTHLLRPEFDSILNVQVCRSQICYLCSSLSSLVLELVMGNGQYPT